MQTAEQLSSLSRLRGLAALLVVAGHAFHVRTLNPHQHEANTTFIIISSATVLFVLIAGILFQMKAYPRLVAGQTRTVDIVRRRWSELSGTYLTVGLFLAIVVGYKEGIREGLNPLVHAAGMVLNGSMAHSYWYVPFFLLLMLLSPLHIWFCRLRLPVQMVAISIGLLISTFIHRPDASVYWAALHSLVYYMPVFWLGLVAGSKWSELLNWLEGKEVLILILFSIVVSVQTVIGQDQVYLHRLGENWGTADLFIIQKTLFALFFISVFHRSRGVSMPMVDWLSKNSLIIFFMHSPVLIAITAAPHLSGFYVPELTLVTVVTILAGVQMHRSLARVYEALPKGVRQAFDMIREGRTPVRWQRNTEKTGFFANN
jgi:hypothetical protein